MTIHCSDTQLNPQILSPPDDADSNPLTIQDYIHMTASLLNDLIDAQGFDCQSMFNSQEPPAIPIEAYLKRLHKFTRFSPECLVMAVIYLDRYNMAEPEFTLNKYNVHRLMLTCIIVAVKYHDDIYFDNLSFERAGGVTVSQLLAFQLEIFEKLDFNAHIEPEQYQALLEKLYSFYIVPKAE